MKAAVLYAFNEPLVVRDVEIDPPSAGEVRVRLAATAVCHSDVHLMHGDWSGALPVVPGHEAAGVIEETGEGVTSIAAGDRVVVSLLRSCGECFQCTGGAPYNCEGTFALDRESRLRDSGGVSLQHGIRTAAFAEYAIVHHSQVVRIPGAMPLETAALLGCGVITGVGAVLNTARVRAGESVVVIGAGGVGLNSIQAAAIAGAKTIIAVDRIESKLAAARAFGATHELNAAAVEGKELIRAVRKTTARGADHAFVTVGSPDAVALAQMMIRTGGAVIVVGMAPLKSTVPLRMFDIVWSDQRVVGSRMGGTRLQSDVPKLVDLYLAGRLKLDELISNRYSLADINEAVGDMELGKALRNLIVF